MNARKIELDQVSHEHFPQCDVLTTFEERYERIHKLRTAMALSNIEHEIITVYFKSSSGDTLEISSNLVDLEDDYVEFHGGVGIPLRAILDVEV